MRLLLFTLLFPFLTAAQSPADWWYFGANAGVHFVNDEPVADTNGMVNTVEGVATISNNQGDLLFYTDGILVFNKNHALMPNGTWLLGSPSSTQSGVICPLPGDPNKFYLFTVANLSGPDGLRYSIVDMTLDGGLGDVDTNNKNIPIVTPITEKVAAVEHSTLDAYWIITHLMNSNEVHAYLLTSAGLNMTPVVSTGNIMLNFGSEGMGYLRPAADGSRLAFAYEGKRKIELFDFDPATGIATNPLALGFVNPNTGLDAGPYGLEFSPSNQFLYAAPRAGFLAGYVYQFDLTSNDSSTIQSTSTVIKDSLNTGALQRGVNNRIYCAPTFDSALHCIYAPNLLGTACSLVVDDVYLNGRVATQGLPTFVSSFFQADFEFAGECQSDSIFFTLDTIGIDSVLWTFGDPASGINDTSTALFPAHVYTDTGTFIVTLVAFSDSLVDSVFREVYIYPNQSAVLGVDVSICAGDSVVFSVDQPFASFLWSSASTDSAIVVKTDALISVTVSGVCDTVSDTVMVTIDSVFNFSLGPDTLLCSGASYLIDPSIGQTVNYLWSTGSTSSTITASSVDEYILTASNTCDTIVDTVNVAFLPTPLVVLPPDTVNCTNALIQLTRPLNDSINYLWSDGSTKATYTVDSSQTVVLTASNKCGTSTDTMKVIQIGNLIVNLGPDTQLCPGDTILLRATTPEASYVWSTGATSDSIWTNTIDDQYSVTVTNDTCRSSDRINIQFTDLACEQIDCELIPQNVFTPNGDGWNDRFRIRSTCDILSFDLYIYSRWGQLVHYSSNDRYGWDGYINGEEAPEGVYYFVVNYTDLVVVDADRQVVQGSFTLIR